MAALIPVANGSEDIETVADWREEAVVVAGHYSSSQPAVHSDRRRMAHV